MLDALHDLIRDPPDISDQELGSITSFVAHALTDPEARPDRLMHLVPGSVPSGLPVHDFQRTSPSSCD